MVQASHCNVLRDLSGIENHLPELKISANVPMESRDALRDTRMSLLRCFRYRLVDEMITNVVRLDEYMSSDRDALPCPRWILLRRDEARHAHEWTVRDFAKWCQMRLATEEPQNAASLNNDARHTRLDPSLCAGNLQAVARLLGFSYAGTSLESIGLGGDDECHENAVPYLPSSVPIRRRVTYWRWKRRPDVRDVIVASLDQVLTTIVCCQTNSNAFNCENGVGILQSLLAYRTIHDDQAWQLYLSQLHNFLEPPDPTVWTTSDRAGCARPLLVSDYEMIAQQMGCEYVGVQTDEGSVVPNEVPLSLLHSHALFKVTNCDYWTGVEIGEQKLASYLDFHKACLRKQPTYQAIRREIAELAG